MLFQRNHYMYSHLHTRILNLYKAKVSYNKQMPNSDWYLYVYMYMYSFCIFGIIRAPNMLSWILSIHPCTIYSIIFAITKNFCGISMCVCVYVWLRSCVILFRFAQFWWFSMFLCFIRSSFSFEHNQELDAEYKSFTHLKFSSFFSRPLPLCHCAGIWARLFKLHWWIGRHT